MKKDKTISGTIPKVKKIEKLKLSKEQSGFGTYGDKINKVISAFNEHLEEHEKEK